MRSFKDVPLWKDVTQAQWDDWKWQVKNRISTLEDLKQVINLTPEEEEGVKKILRNSSYGNHTLLCIVNGRK